VIGLAKLAFGWDENGFPILINVAWACYDLVLLSVVIDAVNYAPGDSVRPPLETMAELRGRVGAQTSA
jgi:hypothetical protein